MKSDEKNVLDFGFCRLGDKTFYILFKTSKYMGKVFIAVAYGLLPCELPYGKRQ